jgi:hypothetical protein
MTAPAPITITIYPFRRWLPQLVDATAAICEVRVGDIARRGVGDRNVKRARAALVFAARERLVRSWPLIAASVGCKNHTSAISLHQTAQRWRAADPEFRQLSDLVAAVADQIRTPPPLILAIQQEMFHDAQTA